MKSCSTLLVIREMQIRAIMRYCLIARISCIGPLTRVSRLCHFFFSLSSLTFISSWLFQYNVCNKWNKQKWREYKKACFSLCFKVATYSIFVHFPLSSHVCVCVCCNLEFYVVLYVRNRKILVYPVFSEVEVHSYIIL